MFKDNPLDHSAPIGRSSAAPTAAYDLLDDLPDDLSGAPCSMGLLAGLLDRWLVAMCRLPLPG